MKNSVKRAVRGTLILAVLIGVAVGVSILLTDSASSRVGGHRVSASPSRPHVQESPRRAPRPRRTPWNMRDDGTPYLYGDGWFDDSGYFFGVMFTQDPGDPQSLDEIRTNVGMRASRGVSYLTASPGRRAAGRGRQRPADRPVAPVDRRALYV